MRSTVLVLASSSSRQHAARHGDVIASRRRQKALLRMLTQREEESRTQLAAVAVDMIGSSVLSLREVKSLLKRLLTTKLPTDQQLRKLVPEGSVHADQMHLLLLISHTLPKWEPLMHSVLAESLSQDITPGFLPQSCLLSLLCDIVARQSQSLATLSSTSVCMGDALFLLDLCDANTEDALSHEDLLPALSIWLDLRADARLAADFMPPANTDAPDVGTSSNDCGAASEHGSSKSPRAGGRPMQQLLGYYAGAVLVAYYALGCLTYRQLEGWSIEESLYVLTASATTLGCADLVPATAVSRLFTAAYALLGIGVLATNVFALLPVVYATRRRLEAALCALALSLAVWMAVKVNDAASYCLDSRAARTCGSHGWGHGTLRAARRLVLRQLFDLGGSAAIDRLLKADAEREKRALLKEAKWNEEQLLVAEGDVHAYEALIDALEWYQPPFGRFADEARDWNQPSGLQPLLLLAEPSHSCRPVRSPSRTQRELQAEAGAAAALEAAAEAAHLLSRRRRWAWSGPFALLMIGVLVGRLVLRCSLSDALCT